MEDTKTRREFFPIPGLRAYKVNREGEVIGPRGLMKPTKDKAGYMQLYFSEGGFKLNMSVHQAVATTFIPNPDNLPEINHKDEDKENNCDWNLEWCTHQYNSAYSLAKRFCIVSPDGSVHEGINLRQFCIENDVDYKAVHAVMKGKRNHHKGWRAYGKV